MPNILTNTFDAALDNGSATNSRVCTRTTDFQPTRVFAFPVSHAPMLSKRFASEVGKMAVDTMAKAAGQEAPDIDTAITKTGATFVLVDAVVTHDRLLASGKAQALEAAQIYVAPDYLPDGIVAIVGNADATEIGYEAQSTADAVTIKFGCNVVNPAHLCIVGK